MRRTFFLWIMGLCHALALSAQQTVNPFIGTIYNDQLGIYLKINFRDADVVVPGQQVLGKMPGYLGDKHDGRVWLIMTAKVKGKTAKLEMINDYGSEDLKAVLKQDSDSTYTLTRTEGSEIKLVRNNDWFKLPKVIRFNVKK